MKSLLLTSAILLVSVGGVAAQTEAPPSDAPHVAPGAAATHVPGFRASEFTGMDLYTLSPEAVTELRAARPVDPAADPAYDLGTARWTSGETFIAGRDQWENIGSIGDLVLSQDGQIQGVLLDIGGFLGIGARTVMVDTEDLYFVADTATPENLGDFFVVASLSRDQLEALPEWTDENLIAGYAWNDARGTAQPAAAPDAVAHDGDATTSAGLADTATLAPTAEELTGTDVHDASGESIGRVNDLVLNGDAVTGAVIDVGGFLGIGSKSVLVPVDDLTVVRDADHAILRVETSLTREQLEALPEHAG
ncbi:PRC-barrel domain-containing protein [Pseudogemmobacter sonorensis]|uniref:PRC-barrel domain-containing protein n=1 Tax=Pseudogemmobacter sonorensis TaxID=2989681 RepID=UPI0036B70DA9